MRVGQMFPSKYLKAEDLGDANVPVTISEVKFENVGSPGEQEEKPVIYFEGKTKGMVCNKTNANTIAKVVGSDDTEDWPGAKITLYATEVQFQGDMVMAVRVRLKGGAPAKSTISKIEKEGDGPGDELPEFGGEDAKPKAGKKAEKHDGVGPDF